MGLLSPSGVVTYVRSAAFRRFLPDWAIAFALIAYFFIVAEHAQPFNRQFSLSDLSISHPFAVSERVTGVNCILISLLVPVFIIVVFSAAKFNYSQANNKHAALHSLMLVGLGLVVSLSINGVVTDILKNWISRPRPDFLARCGPKSGTPVGKLVDISVCSAPLGINILTDGMRSTPSGHSSISFSGLTFLSLWLIGQLKVLKSGSPQPLYKILLSGTPILLASYIALSRTQDYRHHFFDIILGGIIGNVCAFYAYHRYFNKIWSDDSEKPSDDETSDLLPR